MAANHWCPTLILAAAAWKSHRCPCAEARGCSSSLRANPVPRLLHRPALGLFRNNAFYARNKHRAKPAEQRGQSRALAEAGAAAPCCQCSHHLPAVPSGTACLWMWRDRRHQPKSVQCPKCLQFPQFLPFSRRVPVAGAVSDAPAGEVLLLEHPWSPPTEPQRCNLSSIRAGQT